MTKPEKRRNTLCILSFQAKSGGKYTVRMCAGGLFSVSQDKKARLPVSQKHGYMHEADAGRADFIAAASSQLSASDFLQTQLFSHGRFMRENARFPPSRTSDRYHWCGNPHPFEPSEEYHDNEQSLEGFHIRWIFSRFRQLFRMYFLCDRSVMDGVLYCARKQEKNKSAQEAKMKYEKQRR